jgi:hypothetical protein
MLNKENDLLIGSPEWAKRVPSHWLSGAPAPWQYKGRGEWAMPAPFWAIGAMNQKYRFIAAMQLFAETLARNLAQSRCPRAPGPTVLQHGDYLYDVYTVWAGLISFLPLDSPSSPLIAELEIASGVMADPSNAQEFSERICHAISRLEDSKLDLQ